MTCNAKKKLNDLHHIQHSLIDYIIMRLIIIYEINTIVLEMYKN